MARIRGNAALEEPVMIYTYLPTPIGELFVAKNESDAVT